MHDRNAHEVLIPDHAGRRIEVDPAGAWNVDLDPGMGVAADCTVVDVIGKMQISDTNRAAIPSERSAAIMSTARSRQLPRARVRVRTGSWISFSCRATCLKVRLMVCVMSTSSSRLLADPSARRKQAAQRSSSGCVDRGPMKGVRPGISSAA